jgi:hypothetical protein
MEHYVNLSAKGHVDIAGSIAGITRDYDFGSRLISDLIGDARSGPFKTFGNLKANQPCSTATN